MPVANLSHPLVPVCDVLINSKLWTAEEKAHVASVTVDESLQAPGMFTIELFGPLGPNQKPTWQDDIDRFAIGSEVEIKMGYAGDLVTLTVGEITALEPSFARDRSPRLTVRGYDRRYRLQQGRKTRTFKQQKDSDIAAQIASDPSINLTAETTDSEVTHDYLVQANQSDWDFLSERARSINYDLRVEGKTLLFHPAARAKDEALTLSLAEDLLDFRPRLSAAGQVSEVIVRGWDPKEKKEVIGRARAGDEDASINGPQGDGALADSVSGSAVEPLSSYPVMSQAEADQMARAILTQRLLALVQGSGTCFGRTDLRPGKVIRIEGVGTAFGRRYQVTNTTHSYSPQGGYRTNFSASVNIFDVLLDTDNKRSAASRLNGAMVGVVTNNNDEEGLGRVKVKFPWLSDEDESHWARLAAPMAGKGGVYFLPEVDDEVLVAFEHGDVRFPYVLGALWNGKQAPPATNKDGKNNLRLIQSRSGHIIRLNDEDGKETIEIVDKSAKNSIVFDTAKNTITIAADKDITLSAAQGTITIEAQKIKLTSATETQIAAGSGMQVTASKTMNIKGSTVNIN
jgi:phage protein D/phage baseplate assembly protein gpV